MGGEFAGRRWKRFMRQKCLGNWGSSDAMEPALQRFLKFTRLPLPSSDIRTNGDALKAQSGCGSSTLFRAIAKIISRKLPPLILKSRNLTILFQKGRALEDRISGCREGDAEGNFGKLYPCMRRIDFLRLCHSGRGNRPCCGFVTD